MNEKMTYTMEEINLMCIYDTSDRYILVEEMEEALPFVTDKEMREIMEMVLAKLYVTSDRDFAELPLFPTWEDYDEDTELPAEEVL